MVIQYLSQQANTCSKSVVETLEITEDNPNENIFKKQPPVVFFKKVFLKISQNSLENTCAKPFFDKVA